MIKKVRPAKPQPLWRAERTFTVREHGKVARTPLAAFSNIPFSPSLEVSLDKTLTMDSLCALGTRSLPEQVE